MNSSQTRPPDCEEDLVFGERLQHPSRFAQALFIFIVFINKLTFPFTVALNSLVIIAVKVKFRLRAHKSTDFAVDILVQPIFIALVITLLLEEPSGFCLILQFARSAIGSLVNASLFHLALISGKRYLAIKHPFAYTTLVTYLRLLIASALVWLVAAILQITLLINRKTFFRAGSTFLGLALTFIAFCHITVYRETCRHQQQIAVQQVTQEARKQFEKDK